MERQFFVLLTSTIIVSVATFNVLLEDESVLLADSVDEITVRVCDVHVPCTASIPVEEVDSLLELLL